MIDSEHTNFQVTSWAPQPGPPCLPHLGPKEHLAHRGLYVSVFKAFEGAANLSRNGPIPNSPAPSCVSLSDWGCISDLLQ